MKWYDYAFCFIIADASSALITIGIVTTNFTPMILPLLGLSLLYVSYENFRKAIVESERN